MKEGKVPLKECPRLPKGVLLQAVVWYEIQLKGKLRNESCYNFLGENSDRLSQSTVSRDSKIVPP